MCIDVNFNTHVISIECCFNTQQNTQAYISSDTVWQTSDNLILHEKKQLTYQLQSGINTVEQM